MTAKVAKLGCAIFEVPISYYGRTYEQGKKIGMTDGIAAVWYIVRYNWLTTLAASYRTIPTSLRRIKSGRVMLNPPARRSNLSRLFATNARHPLYRWHS